jgi:hypothetical protein
VGRAFEGDTAHRRSPIFEDAIGAVLNGTAIRGLSSCSGGTSPKAPGRSNDAEVERAPRKRDRRAKQIAEEIERASEPDADAVSSQDETSALSGETPGR